jgi:FixJ family two-component response regulator
MPNIVPTVYVVDDDPSVRTSVARLLRSAGYASETFATPAEFLDYCQTTHVQGCALLDVNMPGLNGLELQQALRAARVAIPVIFLTGHGDIPTSVKAMKGGAVDFLAKPFRDEDLLAAVNSAMARDREQESFHAELRELEALYATLTPREREVMSLAVSGLLNKQIAKKLNASEKTIKIHRGRVTQKMRVDSFASLVRVAGKLGIHADPREHSA